MLPSVMSKQVVETLGILAIIGVQQNYIEDNCLFPCKIEDYYTKRAPNGH